MQRLIIPGLFLLAGAILILGSCKHDPQEMPNPGGGTGGNSDCDTLNVSYPATVFPIFETYCLSCHSGTAPEAGLDLANYSVVAQLAQNGTLLAVIRQEPGYAAMPPGGAKLTDCELAKIEIWINDTIFTELGAISCDPDTVYFENTILPLLQSSCGISGCHDPGTAAERIILTDYQNIMNSGIVVSGNPGESELYEVINETDPDKVMPPPPKSTLTAEQIEALYVWMQQGARNNHCNEVACDTVNVGFAQTVWPIVQGRCFGCHSGPSPQGGISLDNYSNIAAVANSGALMGSIKHESAYVPMPQNGSKLSDCNIAQIQIWINDGTPNN